MLSPPPLIQGNKAFASLRQVILLKGDIYILSTDWDVYVERDFPCRVWYHNKRLDTTQWEFPIEDCATRHAISHDELPTGWHAFTCETEDGSRVRWWHEEEKRWTDRHPLLEEIQPLGVIKAIAGLNQCDWDFRNLRNKPAEGHLRTICRQVCYLMGNATLEEALNLYLVGNPAVVKALSNQGLIVLPGKKVPVDLGNWKYSVLLTILQELAKGCKDYDTGCRLMHKLLTELIAKYRNLDQDWAATKGSLIRKGDVIEVALAKASEQGPAVAPEEVVVRRKFQDGIRVFYDCLESIIKLISKFDYGKPTSMFLPNPNNFGRLIAYTHFVIHCRDLRFLVKADIELAKLHARMGAMNWTNSTKELWKTIFI